MRIAWIVAGGVDRSGEVRIVPHLLDRLEALSTEHDIHVVSLRQEPKPGRWRLAGATVWNVGRRPRRIGALAALARLHRERPFDVVHGFGVVPQGTVAFAASRLLRVPAVVEAPGGEFASIPEIGFGGWRRVPGRLWIRLAAGAGPIVVPSEPVLADARARSVDAVRIPLEIDRRKWPPRAPRPASGGPWRIAWIGSLSEVKDPDFFVSVLVRLRDAGMDVTADVMGQDLLGGRVQRRAERAGLGARIRFHGLLRQEDVRARLDEAHALVVTSRYESGPRVLLEAASRGVPTVGPARGMLSEWAPEAALSVEPWTVERVTLEVRALLRDDARRLAMAHNGAERLVVHDADAVARTWIERYREVREAWR